MMLYRTLDVVIPKYRAVFRQHGISETQWRILRVLWEQDGCGSAKLAERALLPATSLVGVIDRLIAKGLVKRIPGQTDRRKVEISLTPEGRSLLPLITPEIEALYQQIQTTCDRKNWRVMINTMQQIIETA